MRFLGVLALGLGCLLWAGSGLADDWDQSGGLWDDNSANTANMLIHGTAQAHNFTDIAPGVADEDWFAIGSTPRSSYEVVVDGWGGWPAIPTRYDYSGSTYLGGAGYVAGASAGAYGAYSLRWINNTASDYPSRVLVPGYYYGLGSWARYDIRMYETTIYIARYNNAGTQNTVLICQNPTEQSITGFAYWWQGNGALATTSNLSIGPGQAAVVSGAAVAPGTSGSITIAHNGPYGSLNCKAVALEPSTGFSFDTPGVYRPK
jgi:hypothetical protein